MEINTTHNIVKKRDQLSGQFDSRKYEFRNCFHFEHFNDKMTLAGTCLISQCFEWDQNVPNDQIFLHSDDMKKEAAKMMKKINEVAERSENLESQVDAKMIDDKMIWMNVDIVMVWSNNDRLMVNDFDTLMISSFTDGLTV